MIFVTVGTHEQPFNRLVEYMDEWAADHEEEIVIQTGFSTYDPKNCRWQKLFPYQEMVNNVNEARIVITHGGPSSFIMPLQIGKVPIVVPRKYEFNEHVNDHQVDFCNQVARKQGNIIVVEDINMLGEVIEKYDELTNEVKNGLQSNNLKFCAEFEKIVDGLVK
ncbi:MAG: multidrug MFS transporter [Lachnospiraceae bacterium]|nr:multidrug MFS transporter [Lachnospiraceae bacterium]